MSSLQRYCRCWPTLRYSVSRGGKRERFCDAHAYPFYSTVFTVSCQAFRFAPTTKGYCRGRTIFRTLRCSSNSLGLMPPQMP
jgi:hypothetical protein